MSGDSSRIIIKQPALPNGTLEIEATLFQGNVCVAFKSGLPGPSRKIAEEIRSKLYDGADPSIAEEAGMITFKTRLTSLGDLTELLRRIGFYCRELPPMLPLLPRKSRIIINLDRRDIGAR